MNRKIRLDLLLVMRGLVESRHIAQSIILAGKVRDQNGKILDKPGKEILINSYIKILSEPKFVSRGGNKLLEAFKKFPINVRDRICLDVGISTGGFTDCLLQNGAKTIYGVDVGYGQTAWKIRNNSKVTLFERTNVRYLNSLEIGIDESLFPDFVVADLSFISLRLVLNPIKNLLQKDFFEGILLIKHQFEVGREKVSKGGVVRETKHHIEAIESVSDFAMENEFLINGLIESPLKGPAGNQEYLIWISNRKLSDFSINSEEIKSVVFRALR